MSSRVLWGSPGRGVAVAAVLVLSGSALVVAGLPDPSPEVPTATPVPSAAAPGQGGHDFRPGSAVPPAGIRPATAPAATAPVATATTATALPGPTSVASPPSPELASPSGAAVPRRVVTPAGEPLSPSRPLALRVPEIGVSSPLIDLGLQQDRTLEVPEDFSVAGWFDRGPTPGEPGPAVVAGHVDSKAGPAVFYRLAELRPGDLLLVDREDGITAEFAVERIEQHPKAEFPTRDVYGWVDHAGLRLITCGGSFDRGTGHPGRDVGPACWSVLLGEQLGPEEVRWAVLDDLEVEGLHELPAVRVERPHRRGVPALVKVGR